MKKSLLFIDHSFHQKTRSGDFLKELLSSKYEISYFDYFPGVDTVEKLNILTGHYDICVCWQVMPPLSLLKKRISFDKCVFFPMFDGVYPRTHHLWEEYKDADIINFSKTLHLELKEMGFSSHYIQYFPEPLPCDSLGNEKSVFFWHRVERIDFSLMKKILPLDNLDSVHIHQVLDPQQKKRRSETDSCKKITCSNWFSSKEEMWSTMQKSALYFAPRFREGIGMSFLEAMAMGRCVIAPDQPTMNEYIQNGENGFLYDINNPKPITLENIRQIQKKAIETITLGYQKWQKEKQNILQWLEEPSCPDMEKISRCQFHAPNKKIKVYLFGLPFLKMKRRKNQISISLWGIPLLKF